MKAQRLAYLALPILLLGAPAARASLQAPPATLPVPPIPPANPPADLPAPVPNIDLFAPQPAAPTGTVVKPTLNESLPRFPGADPVPGTLYRSDQEQRRQFIPNPGVKVIVPLEK